MKEKIDQLKQQADQAKTLFLKLQGAIEILEAMEKEKKDQTPKEKVAKDDKK
jgi:hypothetical protein